MEGAFIFRAFTAIIKVPFSRKCVFVPLLECFELKLESNRTQSAEKLLTFDEVCVLFVLAHKI